MVAVVSGSGLGLFNSSASSLGGDNTDNAKVGRGQDRLYVNTTTGNLIVQSVDETLTALGLDFAAVRTYNSQGLTDEDNGDNWRLGVHMRLSAVTGGTGVNTDGSKLTKTFGDGAEVVYTYNTSRSRYESTEGDGANDYLTWNGSVWTWTDASSRVTEEYALRGGVQRIRFSRDADLNTVTYNYNTAGTLLTSMDMANPGAVTNNAQTVTFGYGGTLGTNLMSVSVTSWNGTVLASQTLTSYTYDTSNRLETVTVDLTPTNTADSAIYRTTYTYEGTSKRVSSITQTDGSTVSFGYQNINGDYRLQRVTDGENRITTFTYNDVLSSGGTQQNATAIDGRTTNQDTVNTPYPYNPNTLVRGEQLPNTTQYPLNTNQLTPAAGGSAWGTASVLEAAAGSTSSTSQVAFDSSGNGFALRTASGGGSNTVKVWRYTRSTNSWSTTATTLYTSSTTAAQASLAVDAGGNAIVAWMAGTQISTVRYTGSWGTVSNVPSTSASLKPTIAINGTQAAVIWGEGSGTGRSAYVSRWTGSAWTAKQTVDNQTLAANDLQIAVDSLGNVIAAWSQVEGSNTDPCVWTNQFRVSSNSWTGAVTRDITLPAAISPQIALDSSGNGFLAFAQGTETYVARYTGSTNTWGTPTVVDNLAGTVRQTSLSVDPSGNAVLAWIQATGAVDSAYARVYNATSATWSAVTPIESLTTTVTNGSLRTSIRGSVAGAVWLQNDGTRENVYAATYNGTWSTAATIETSTQTPTSPSIAIDSSGNASAVWIQSNGTALSVYSNRFTVGAGGTAYYLVPAGATWRSIAATLYGIDSDAAGTALQTALPGQSIAANSQIPQTSLPSPLPVTTYSTVPDYYLVPGTPSTPTWRSIAAVVYGIDSAAAGTALQTRMAELFPGQYQTLSVGLHISGLPTPITVPTQITLPYNYHVVQSASWAATVQNIYGFSDPGLIEAVKNFSGVQTDTLVVGSRLQVQLTQPYIVGGSGTGPSIYQRTDVQAPLGLTTYYKDAQGRLVSVLTPAVGGTRIETRYTYDPTTGNVQTITLDPTGLNRVTTFGYDPNTGLLTSTRDSLGNFTSRTYNTNNQLETETSYVNRATTGTPTGASMVTRYVYDGSGATSENHLRFVVTPDGRVTEHVYNANGERTTSYKYAASTYSGAYTEAALNTWATGQRGSALERITYAYDFRSNISTLTTWQLTDANGFGYGDLSITRFVYDQRGMLLSKIDARGETTTAPNDYITNYTYDGLGRARTVTSWVSATEPARLLKTITYDDAIRRTVTSFAGGRTQTELYNRSGDLVDVAMGPLAVGSTTFTYDANGRLRVSKDATGVKTFCFYDEAGRKIGYVDGDGSLTESIFNRAGQVVKTIRYSKRITADTLTSLGLTGWNTIAFADLRTEANTTPATNQITRNVYDASGTLVYTLELIDSVNQYNAVTKNVYDGAGRLTDQIRFAATQTLDTSIHEVLASSITVSESNTANRRTRYFYNADGQLTGTLDGAGYLKENVYDAGGRLVTQIGYYNPSDSSRWLTGTLSTLRPGPGGGTAQLDPERDIRTRFFYDARGFKRGEFDGERYLTEFVYDAAGNLQQKIRYDSRLTDSGDNTTFLALKNEAFGVPNHSTTYTYNGLGQVLTETNFENTETLYSYDIAGNLIATTRANNTPEARKTQTRYDALGRVDQELTAEGSAALAALTGTPTQAQINEVWSKFGIKYEYDFAGRRISATVRPDDLQTNTTYFYYDNDGRLRFELDPLGRVTENRYDALGQITDRLTYWRTVTIPAPGPKGGLLDTTLIGQLTGTEAADVHEKTTYGYSLRGQISSTLTAANATTASTYNIFGELETSTVGALTALSYTYDGRGLQKLTKRGTLTLEDRTFDAFGRLKQLVDRGNTRTVTYDRLGREITTSESGDPNTTLKVYDAFSRVLSVRDKLLNVTGYSYNDSTKTVTVTTPENILVTTVHNRHGDTVNVTANGNTTVYEYDLQGKLKNASDNLGALEGRGYDRSGRQVSATDARGTITKLEYDAANRLLKRTVDTAGSGALALVTTYAYDPAQRVMTVTEPGNRVTRTEYDRDGRVAAVEVDPNGNKSRTKYDYDSANNAILVTEGVNAVVPTTLRRTKYVYDTAGRRTDEYLDPIGLGGSLDLRTQYVYDDNDNLVRKIDAENNSTWYVYDAQHRLRQTIDALGGVTELSYDAADRVVETRRYYNGVTPNFGNSPTLQTVTKTVNDRVTRSVYDRDGREKYTLATSSATGSPGAVTEKAIVTERTFDKAGNVTQTRVYRNEITVPGAVDIVSITNAINDPGTGNSTSTVHKEDHIERMVYDLRGRLEISIDGSGAVTKFQYDLNGNVTQKTEYAATVPVDGAMRVWYRSGTNSSAQVSLGNFAAGDTVTATVRFKAPPGTNGMMFLGNVAGPYAYDNAVQTPLVNGNDGWQTLTLTRTMSHADDMYVYVYGNRDGANPNSSQSVIYDDVKVSSVQRGTVLADKFDGTVANWGVSGLAQSETVTLADLGIDAVVRGFVNSLGNNDQDRVTRFWYDTLDRERFALDAEGYLVETKYLDADRQQQQIVYADKPAIAADATIDLVANAANNVPRPTLTQITTQTFDAAGRVIKVTDAAGSEHFGYDGVGNRIKYVNRKGTDANDTRYTWTYEYDANHRLTFERSPVVPVTTVDPVTLDVTTSNQQLVTYNEYDRLGNLRHRTEAYSTIQARVTSFEYDVLGRQTAAVSPSVGVYNPAQGDGEFGNGGVTVLRRELARRIRSETVYDVFGNAFRNRLVTDTEAADPLAGVFTFKAYDNLGRVKYEVDAKNQVTSYRYDVFGNQLDVIRHALPLTSGLSKTDPKIPLATVAGLVQTGAADRKISTSFDRMGRALTVLQPLVRNFVPTVGGSGGAYLDERARVDYTYNAFGQVVKASELITTGVTGDNYFYYDRRGLKVAELDSSRYLTRYWYDDETGDLTRTIEYARPTTGTVNIDGFGSIVTSTNGTAEGDDRETTFGYDKLNRKTSETRLNREFWGIGTNGQLGNWFDGSQQTTFGYDELGNQTRVTVIEPGTGTALNTFTYYDVLGRAIAVAQPRRDLGLGTFATPYTRMLRDAHDNLVQSIDYYDSVTAVEGTPPTTPTGNAGLNRTTTMLSDLQGHLLATRDATNAVRYASYNIRGDVAKEWQVVVNPNTLGSPISDTLVTIYRYDELGQTKEVQQSQRYEGVNTIKFTRMANYNAFGEVIEKYNLGDASKQYFDYDNAGRVWRTNSEDGVAKVLMYDLAGRATLELRSQGTNLAAGRTDTSAGSYTSAQQVLDNVAASSLMRTETAYDLKGNIVERRLPTFQVSTGMPAVGPNLQLQSINGVAHITWQGTLSGTVNEKFEARVLGSQDWTATPEVIQLSPGLVGVNVHGLYNTPYEYRIRYTRGADVVPYAESSGTFKVDRLNETHYYSISPTVPDAANDVATLRLEASGPRQIVTSWVQTSQWNGTSWQYNNKININLSGLGGPVTISLHYVNTSRLNGATHNQTKIIELDSTAGVTFLEWSDNTVYPTPMPEFGGLRNDPITVSVFGGPGATGPLLGSTTAQPQIPMLVWDVPPGASLSIPDADRITVKFKYKRPSDGTWSEVTPERYATSFRVPVRDLLVANSTYQYQVEYTRYGEVIARRGGEMTSDGNASIRTVVNSSIGDAALTGIYEGTVAVPGFIGTRMYWGTPSVPAGQSIQATFECYLGGNLVLSSTLPPNVWEMELGGLARNTTHTYRMTYRIGQRVVAEQTGSFQVAYSAESTDTAITNAPGGAPVQVGDIGTLSGENNLASATGEREFSASWVSSPTPMWRNTNQIKATWTPVAGNVPIRVEIRFYRLQSGSGLPETSRSGLKTFDMSSSTSEIHPFWTEPGSPPNANRGGVAVVTASTPMSVTVWGQDATGAYTVKLRETGATGSGATPKLRWAEPQNPQGLVGTFTYSGPSSGTLPITTSGGIASVDLGNLNGTFNFTVTYTRPGESLPVVTRSGGQFTANGVASTIVSQGTPSNNNTAELPVSIAGSLVSWVRPPAGNTVTFKYRLQGATNWETNRQGTSSDGSTYILNLSGLLAGTYEYRVEYQTGAQPLTALGNGLMNVTVTFHPASDQVQINYGSVASPNYPTQRISPISMVSASDVVTWTFSKLNDVENDDILEFKYTVGGVEYSASINGSGPTYTAQLTAVPINNNVQQSIPWTLTYRRPGQSDPYAKATGTATIRVDGIPHIPNVTNLTQAPVFPSGAIPLPAPTDLGGNYFGWSSLSAAGTDTVTLKINNQTVTPEIVGSGRRINLTSYPVDTTLSYELTFTNAQGQPYARASGTFRTSQGPGAMQPSSTMTINSPRAENALEMTPTFGTGVLITPPWAVYHLVPFGQGGARLEYGPRAPGTGPDQYGGYSYTVAPGTTGYPNGAWTYWDSYQYIPAGQMISFPRTTGDDTEAVLTYWPVGTTNTTSVDALVLPLFTMETNPNGPKVWRFNLTALTTDGTYGYRIELRRAGSASAYQWQDGTFTRANNGASRTITPTSSTAPTITDVTPTTKQKFDRWGNLIETKDAARNVSNYRYNGNGQVVQTQEAFDDIYTVTVGLQTRQGRAEKKNYYDLLGRLVETRDGNDRATRAAYNAGGQQITNTAADTGVKSTTYDIFGNVQQTIDELGYLTRYVYDKLGRVKEIWREIERPNGQSAFTVPGDPSSTAVSAANLINVQTQRFVYDEAGRRVSETNGIDTEITRYRYDLQGNVSRRITNQQSQYNVGTNYVYDANGKLITETDALGTTKSWVYDPFGRLTSHTQSQNGNGTVGEAKGQTISYSYANNFAGLLDGWTSGTATNGQSVVNSYDAAGNLVGITDGGMTDNGYNVNRLTLYRYDSAGRRSRETVFVDGRQQQDTRITYDAHNRIRNLDDPDYREQVFYDANGNRSYLTYSYLDHEGALNKGKMYYSYDAVNRVKTTSNYDSKRQGTYDATFDYNVRGDRTAVTGEEIGIWERQTIGSTVDYDIINYRMDNATEHYTYDGLGRLKTVYRDIDYVTMDTMRNELSRTKSSVTTHVYTYDKANRVTDDLNTNIQETVDSQNIETGKLITRFTHNDYDADGRALTTTVKRNSSSGNLESVTQFGRATLSGTNGLLGYDDAGNLRGYDVYSYNPDNGNPTYKTEYRSSYQLRESYLETSQSAISKTVPGGVGSGSLPGSATSTRDYNINGELVHFSDSGDATRGRYFANNQSGQALTVMTGQFASQADIEKGWDKGVNRSGVAPGFGKAQYYFFANSNFIGTFGQLQKNGVFEANFDTTYTPVSNSYPPSVPATVVTQEGDTLRTVAARIFGDASLWYIIAEENGLSNPDETQRPGTQLRIPNEVVSLTNTANSFKPFNPADALGDTSPTQPAPPAPKAGCGVLGMIIMIVVMVVVTIFTAGAMIAAAGPAVSGFGSIMSAGMTALTGGSVAIGGGLGASLSFVGGAIAAATGSVASQLVGMAIGAQDKFDWKSVATSAIGGGVSAALGGGLIGLKDGAGTVAKALNIGANAAVSSSITQGVSMAVGLQDSFSWRQVAASAVGAVVSAGAGALANKAAPAMSNVLGNGITKVAGETFTRFAGGVASASVMGGKIDYTSIAADAFGNAVGNAIVGAIQQSYASKQLLAKLAVKTGKTIDEITAVIRERRAQQATRSGADRGNLFMMAFDGVPQDTLRELWASFESGKTFDVVVGDTYGVASFAAGENGGGTITLNSAYAREMQRAHRGVFENFAGAELLFGLWEEEGHAADHRARYLSGIGGDSSFDEGALFAYFMAADVVQKGTSGSLTRSVQLAGGSTLTINTDMTSLKAVTVATLNSGRIFRDAGDATTGREFYGPEGHYMTTGVIALPIARQFEPDAAKATQIAATLALWSQMPDLLDWMDARAQWEHALSEEAFGFSREEKRNLRGTYEFLHNIPLIKPANGPEWVENQRAISRKIIMQSMQAGDYAVAGLAIHRLGDSYAHTDANGDPYVIVNGHLGDSIAGALGETDPDNLFDRPAMARTYAADLANTLARGMNPQVSADYGSTIGLAKWNELFKGSMQVRGSDGNEGRFHVSALEYLKSNDGFGKDYTVMKFGASEGPPSYLKPGLMSSSPLDALRRLQSIYGYKSNYMPFYATPTGRILGNRALGGAQ